MRPDENGVRGDGKERAESENVAPRGSGGGAGQCDWDSAARFPFEEEEFDGEQHGFRRADNIKRALDAELYFFAAFLSGQPLEFRASA